MIDKFKVEDLEINTNDLEVNFHHYLVTLSDGTEFICERHNSRYDKIYFPADVQSKLDSNLLNEIETFILGFEGVR